MKVGMIGLGKLGLPVALAIESRGHEVKGYDTNPEVEGYLRSATIPYREEGLQPLLDSNHIEVLNSIAEVVEWADIVFCAVHTPHDSRFEGSTRLPEDRKDFNYDYLKKAVADVSAVDKETTLVVISTCLPGTYNRYIKPLVGDKVNYVYNPFFIAMGTVLDDFLDPEFVLVGESEWCNGAPIGKFYASIHGRPILFTDVTTAEAIKVSYNTFITTKTVLANLWGQIAEKTGANVDDIYRAWSLATDRLISPKYLQAGMSDGGGCHPRDNIALSYISDQLGLKYNFFESLMKARESHEEWIADYILDMNVPYPVIVLGRSFKPGTNITAGSPAALLVNLLAEKGVEVTQYDPFIDEVKPNLEQRAVIVVATQHAEFASYRFRQGSIVIDPFGYIADQPGVDVRRLGRK